MCYGFVSKWTLSDLTMDLITNYPTEPSLKNLTSPKWGPPAPERNPVLMSLGAPHVDSFNFMLEDGLKMAVEDLVPVEFSFPKEENTRIKIWIKDCWVEKPRVEFTKMASQNPLTFPSEFRQGGGTYRGNCKIRFAYSINNIEQPSLERSIGKIPIMVLSNACNLNQLTPEELVKKGEQETEWGGYFVIGGHERIIRMLQTTRRNYPVAMSRSSWKKRGKNFSDLGVLIECSKPDLTVCKNVLHFVTTGSARYMINYGKELYFVPVIMILKCLTDRSDAAIFEELIASTDPNDHYYRGCLKNMLQEPQREQLFSCQQVREYIGCIFNGRLKYDVPEWFTNEEICDYLIGKQVCPHLSDNEEKFQLIVFMVKKLFALVQDRCVVEGADSIMMHEIVVGGHLYLQLLKEKLQKWMVSLKYSILKKVKDSKIDSVSLNSTTIMNCATRTISIEKQFENFLSTGNLPSETGLGLMQAKGITIMAENINRMRYMSHFRAIHRGSFFQEMRTTDVRALLPDAWGFVCPVHTPDGSPCGLLNHLAMPVKIVNRPLESKNIPKVLEQLGMYCVDQAPEKVLNSCYHVLLNGKIIGYVSKRDASEITEKLRILKVKKDDDRVPTLTEIVLVTDREHPGQYPGVFIFTGAARMMRPVLNLTLNQIEMIGTFEQIYMDICISPEEMYKETTHQEIRQNAFLSNLACTIPLPDFNQSPRNMYQCQMGKQTMATPTHTWHLNSETKMYRLQTPSSPFFRPAHYDFINMDQYPMGTNAIVAVISYTAYDMEDAMIINKSSFERGFAAGSIYKSSFVDLFQISTGRKNNRFSNQSCDLVFKRDPDKPDLVEFLDTDGLPYVGTRLYEGQPLYCYFDESNQNFVVKKYDGKEVVYVDAVKFIGSDLGTEGRTKVCISYRLPRNPNVGDKFASRAGQKGICSQKWPCEDLPWTSEGLVPDILFNPHGFPSRMTIAMMIECMAGKSGALYGMVHDATPFRFGEGGAKGGKRHNKEPVDAIDYFARQLENAGYNYYGTETLYSGTDGTELKAEIFFGIIHYQRLRHMVSDKFQVRSVGVMDQITRQPLKGRRRGGGVRFGEMERDCLLSHGSMFLLQDRLFYGSDKARFKVCTNCGSLLSPRVYLVSGLGSNRKVDNRTVSRYSHHVNKCQICNQSTTVADIDLPHIFYHLVCELASVNIKIKFATSHI